MCMMDWRIGRLIRTATKQITTPTAGVVVLQQNSQRVAFEIWYASVGLPNLTSIGPYYPFCSLTANGEPLAFLNAFDSHYHASLLTHGDVSTREISARGTDDTDICTVTEWVLPENVLADSLKSFESEYGKWQR